jgi:hypothetical protein
VFPASAPVGHNAPVNDSSANAAEDGLNWCIGDIAAFFLVSIVGWYSPSVGEFPEFEDCAGVKDEALPRCGVADNKAGFPLL